MTWFLSYLLFGFVISWIGSQIMGIKAHESWQWELAATLLWPVTIVCAVAYFGRRRKPRSPQDTSASEPDNG